MEVRESFPKVVASWWKKLFYSSLYSFEDFQPSHCGLSLTGHYIRNKRTASNITSIKATFHTIDHSKLPYKSYLPQINGRNLLNHDIQRDIAQIPWTTGTSTARKQMRTNFLPTCQFEIEIFHFPVDNRSFDKYWRSFDKIYVVHCYFCFTYQNVVNVKAHNVHLTMEFIYLHFR